MFQIVVAVISVALVAVLSLSVLFYGGSAFVNSGTKATVEQFIAATQQISAAQTLYSVERGGAYVVDHQPGDAVEGLVTANYLKATPALPKVAAKDAKWLTTASPHAGAPPVIGIALDGDDAATQAICDAMTKLNAGRGGCVDDLSQIATGK